MGFDHARHQRSACAVDHRIRWSGCRRALANGCDALALNPDPPFTVKQLLAIKNAHVVDECRHPGSPNFYQ